MLLTIPAGQERVRGDERVVPESVHGRGGESEGGEEVAGGQEEDQDVTDITTSPLSHTDRSQARVNQISTEREREPCRVSWTSALLVTIRMSITLSPTETGRGF